MENIACNVARTSSTHHRETGFSLIELAVVIVVVTLLLGSLLVPLATQIEQRRYAETEKQLEHIKEALIGFALSRRYFPCPAISATNGLEDRDTSTQTCTDPGTGVTRAGFLPWVTLGVTQYDAWDNLFRYSVNPTFVRSDPNNLFTLSSVGDIQVNTRNGATVINLTNNDIPVSIVSHGKNGFGATTSAGSARFTPGSWTGDEQINATGSNQVYVRDRTENTSASGGEFDDVVAWVSLNQLFARMVSAGRLP